MSFWHMTPRGFFMWTMAICAFMGTIVGAGLGMLLWSTPFFVLAVVSFALALRCRHEGWPTERGAQTARVLVRPIDPREGNEWTEIGIAKKIEINYEEPWRG